jgi:hypothetical protein
VGRAEDVAAWLERLGTAEFSVCPDGVTLLAVVDGRWYLLPPEGDMLMARADEPTDSEVQS